MTIPTPSPGNAPGLSADDRAEIRDHLLRALDTLDTCHQGGCPLRAMTAAVQAYQRAALKVTHGKAGVQ